MQEFSRARQSLPQEKADPEKDSAVLSQAAQPGNKLWHCAQQAVPCSQPHPAFLWCQQKENSTTTNSGRYPSNLDNIQSLKECTLQKDLVCWHEIKRINPRLFTKIKTTFKEARNPGGSKVFPSSSTFSYTSQGISQRVINNGLYFNSLHILLLMQCLVSSGNASWEPFLDTQRHLKGDFFLE